MSKRRPDVVFYCQDGHGDRRFIQRMRLASQQGIWVPQYKRSPGQYLTEHGEDFASHRVKEVSAAAPPVRVRDVLLCTCGGRVRIRNGRLQFFCDRVAPLAGNDVSLVFLRGWLHEAPSWQAYPDALGNEAC